MLDPGDLDGFQIESDEEYEARLLANAIENAQLDWEILQDGVAIRAIWSLLYRRQWKELRQIGISRKDIEPKLAKFSHYPEHLSRKQVYWLRRKLPELERPSLTIRAKYIRMYLGG